MTTTVANKQLTEAQESENRSKAAIVSLLFHLGLLAIMYFYRFGGSTEIAQPPAAIQIEWGGGGDDAAKGMPDRGMNSDYTPPGEDVPTPAPTPPPKASAPVAQPKPASPPPSTVPTTEDPNVAALRKQQQERERQQREAAERYEREQAQIAEAKRQADEKARADQARRDQIKKNSGGAFGGKQNGTGTGAGGGGNPGNGGNPNGTGNNPFGNSPGGGGGQGGGQGTGTGVSIGGGLGGRAVRSRPSISDNSNDAGTVVINVCVDSEGNVTSATPSLKGTTTTSSTLKSKALAAANQFKFAKGGGANDCGTIAFNFRVK